MRPEIKIVSYIFFIIFLFLLNNIKAYIFISVILFVFLLKVPLNNLKSGWISICLFLIFTFISNVVNQHGRILFSVGPFLFTEEGLNIAAIRTARIAFMIMGAKILISTAKIEEIVKALGKLLSPFERLGFPIKEFSHTMELTMKCFPILKNMVFENYRTNIELGNVNKLWDKARIIATFMLPMFIKSIQSPEVFFENSVTNDK